MRITSSSGNNCTCSRLLVLALLAMLGSSGRWLPELGKSGGGAGKPPCACEPGIGEAGGLLPVIDTRRTVGDVPVIGRLASRFAEVTRCIDGPGPAECGPIENVADDGRPT